MEKNDNAYVKFDASERVWTQGGAPPLLGWRVPFGWPDSFGQAYWRGVVLSVAVWYEVMPSVWRHHVQERWFVMGRCGNCYVSSETGETWCPRLHGWYERCPKDDPHGSSEEDGVSVYDYD